MGSLQGRLIIVQGGLPSLSATFILDQITGLIDRGWQIENWATYGPKAASQHEAVRKYDLLKHTKYLRFPDDSLAHDPDLWVKTFCQQNSLRSLEDEAAFHVHYGPNVNALAPSVPALENFPGGVLPRLRY